MEFIGCTVKQMWFFDTFVDVLVGGSVQLFVGQEGFEKLCVFMFFRDVYGGSVSDIDVVRRLLCRIRLIVDFVFSSLVDSWEVANVFQSCEFIVDLMCEVSNCFKVVGNIGIIKFGFFNVDWEKIRNEGTEYFFKVIVIF